VERDFIVWISVEDLRFLYQVYFLENTPQSVLLNSIWAGCTEWQMIVKSKTTEKG
jgi:hypothetical protein